MKCLKQFPNESFLALLPFPTIIVWSFRLYYTYFPTAHACNYARYVRMTLKSACSSAGCKSTGVGRVVVQTSCGPDSGQSLQSYPVPRRVSRRPAVTKITLWLFFKVYQHLTVFSLLAQFDITVFTAQPHKVQPKRRYAQLREDRHFSAWYATSSGHDNVGDPFVCLFVFLETYRKNVLAGNSDFLDEFVSFKNGSKAWLTISFLERN